MRQRQNFCVISIRFFLHRTHWIGVFAFAYDITAVSGLISKGIPSVQLPAGTSRAFDDVLHRAADPVGSEADTVPDQSPAMREHPAPQPIFYHDLRSVTSVSANNEFLQTILPAFTIPNRTSSLVSH